MQTAMAERMFEGILGALQRLSLDHFHHGSISSPIALPSGSGSIANITYNINLSVSGLPSETDRETTVADGAVAESKAACRPTEAVAGPRAAARPLAAGEAVAAVGPQAAGLGMAGRPWMADSPGFSARPEVGSASTSTASASGMATLASESHNWIARERAAFRAGIAASQRKKGLRAEVVTGVSKLQPRVYVLLRCNQGIERDPPTYCSSWSEIKPLVTAGVTGQSSKLLHPLAVFQGFPSQREADQFVLGAASQ